MKQFLILLGGNLGDHSSILKRFDTYWKYQNFGTWLKKSSIYTSTAWGVKNPDEHPLYWNQARILETSLSAHEVLMIGQLCQLQFNNQKTYQNDDREFDFDLIQMGDCVFQDVQLDLPHPRTLKRGFALQCIQEIAAENIYPGQQHTYKTIWDNFQTH